MRVLGLSALGAALILSAAGHALAVPITTVQVGNAGNAADTRFGGLSMGSVSYDYRISKFEITSGQYTEFLNAVAATDTYGLYNVNMVPRSVGWTAGIQRTGTSGNYQYSVAADLANRPINYVSWGDAARFCNWLQNGKPTGGQSLATTESGSYYLNGATTAAALMAVVRQSGASWVLPTEDEWYKAAYHMNDGVTGDYATYPNGTNDITTDQANFASAVGRATDVGAYNVASPYGTFDQAGNMWEWNESVVFGSSRGMRGGSLYSSLSGVSASSRSGGSATYETDSVGFRVVQVPEPASMGLLVGGSALMAWWRRRR